MRAFFGAIGAREVLEPASALFILYYLDWIGHNYSQPPYTFLRLVTIVFHLYMVMARYVFYLILSVHTGSSLIDSAVFTKIIIFSNLITMTSRIL